jgi:hypothetical protein
MNEPRIYKQPVFNWIAIVFLTIVLFGGVFGMSISRDFTLLLIFAIIFILLIGFSIFSLTAKTIISEDEISSQNLLGTKTLRWSEISRVSGSGYGIKLHNYDGDVTVAPSPQLPGYEEVIEIIGAKRPDLFNPQEYSEMTRGWMGILAQSFAGLVAIGFGIFIYLDTKEFVFPLIFAFVIGLVIIGMAVFAPQSVTIDGNSIIVNYLFNQKTLRANEIDSISLGYTQTRNGKNYYVQITQKSGGNIRISNVKPNLPVAYHVLKNWHKKNATNILMK